MAEPGAAPSGVRSREVERGILAARVGNTYGLEEAWREPANGELPPRQSPRPNPRRYPPPRPNPVGPTGHLDFIIAKIQVTGDRRHDCSLTVAAIERVRLDHERREIGPPNLSPLNFVHLYHESFSMDLSWARCSPPSTLPGRREYTSFRRSVTACCCCRFRYSALPPGGKCRRVPTTDVFMRSE